MENLRADADSFCSVRRRIGRYCGDGFVPTQNVEAAVPRRIPRFCGCALCAVSFSLDPLVPFRQHLLTVWDKTDWFDFDRRDGNNVLLFKSPSNLR